MKNNHGLFIFVEVILLIVAVLFIIKFLENDRPEKKVAVILNDSGEEKWNAAISGLKKGAKEKGIHIVICNTDEIDSANEEKEIIDEQLANGVCAIVAQPAPGKDSSKVLIDTNKKVPVLLIDSGVNDKYENLPTIEPDQYSVGVNLGIEMKESREDGLRGKTIGIVGGIKGLSGNDEIEEGFRSVLENTGCKVEWTMNYFSNLDAFATNIEAEKPVDFIAVLETSALEEVGSLSESNSLHGALVYGIGNSEKTFDFLDREVVQGLVTVDDFEMGYMAASEISRKISNRFYKMTSRMVSIREIHKEDLFKDENEVFLYSFK